MIRPRWSKSKLILPTYPNECMRFMSPHFRKCDCRWIITHDEIKQKIFLALGGKWYTLNVWQRKILLSHFWRGLKLFHGITYIKLFINSIPTQILLKYLPREQYLSICWRSSFCNWFIVYLVNTQDGLCWLDLLTCGPFNHPTLFCLWSSKQWWMTWEYTRQYWFLIHNH